MDYLVCDQGSEFNSNDVEHALARLGVSKVERPASKPRFGGIIERLFEIANDQVFHEMCGSTKLVSLGRGLSASHRPSRHAQWTLPMLHQVCEQWLFKKYPKLRHGTLGATKQEVFSQSLRRNGERVARHVADDFGLRLALAQTPKYGAERKVDATRGIHLGYLRFSHDLFQYGDVAGSSAPVKSDRTDATVALAFVRGEWRECRLWDQGVDLHGRSWKQIQLAVAELRKRKQLGRADGECKARLIGRFLRRLDHTGDLARQIVRDSERLLVGAPGSVAESAPELRLVSSVQDPAGTDLLRGQVGSAAEDDDLPDDFDDLEAFDVN